MAFLKAWAKNQADPLLGKPASWGIHRYLQGSSNLFEENRLLKFAIVGLFGVTAVLGAVIYTSNQNQRTVVVPFGAGGDLYVTGNRPSPEYLRTMTRNIVATSAGVSNASVSGVRAFMMSFRPVRTPRCGLTERVRLSASVRNGPRGSFRTSPLDQIYRIRL